MIPTLLVALTTSNPVLGIVAVVILYLAVQQLENAVLVPKIQGDAVQLHPSLVIFALIVGGSIAGLLGAILAIPITAAARDVYRYLFHRLSDDEVDAAAGTNPPGPTDQTPPRPAEDPVADSTATEAKPVRRQPRRRVSA